MAAAATVGVLNADGATPPKLAVRHPSSSRDKGHSSFLLLPAALVGAIAVQTTVQPVHPAWMLVALAVSIADVLGGYAAAQEYRDVAVLRSLSAASSPP